MRPGGRPLVHAVALVVALGVAPGIARAERSLHVGLDVRTDLGTHHTRLPIGYRACLWDTTLVLDPMVILDGQHDLDLLVERYVGSRIALLAGLRWTAIAVDGGLHHQERTLLGVTGVGPTFFDDRLLTKLSLEVATLWVKHGGGAETDWISADRNLLDHFSVGLFLRVEYARIL
jgi:hypothetical protein